MRHAFNNSQSRHDKIPVFIFNGSVLSVSLLFQQFLSLMNSKCRNLENTWIALISCGSVTSIRMEKEEDAHSIFTAIICNYYMAD